MVSTPLAFAFHPKSIRTVLLIPFFVFPLTSQTGSSPKSQPTTRDTYEDDEVQIPIPAGWTRASGQHPALEPVRAPGGAVIAGNSVLQADAKLLLEKDGYTLALAYRADHASGIVGGRFIEAFQIPWLDPDMAWTCSLSLREVPQPASSTLLFENLLIDTDNTKVREECGIPKTLTQSFTLPGVTGPQLTSQRWFAGYFTDAKGGWFFDESNNEVCGSKVFSLTTTATKPDQLPIPEDPHLQRLIQESIDIVNSIHYKRCAPKPSSPFR